MCSVSNSSSSKSKRVWIWTESKQVMTAAVERGWNTFVFLSENQQLAIDWSTIALLDPLFIKEGEVFDSGDRRVGSIIEVSTPQELQQLQPADGQAENIVIDLLDWQVIPAENIVASFQGSGKTVFAISKTPSEAQIFLEALEQGLGGIVLKVEDVKAVLALKEYFDGRNEVSNLLSLMKATVTRVDVAGMGDRVCVDLCSLMRPGEGLLVGSFARGLFLVHSECLESNYIASRPFRVNATNSGDQTLYGIILQNAETVALVSPCKGTGEQEKAIPVTSLKVGDEVLLRVQGAARHTGIEIQEFIVEN
ncbi:3-dehydroquinate synthase [Citrus sinensis]|nr:3-dehydroquinate synthase [Citrus sinensis]